MSTAKEQLIAREKISQAEAARLKGVSRQYISTLRNTGRLSIIYDENNIPTSKVWKDEIVSLSVMARGRPKLTEEEIAERNKDSYGFNVGDILTWVHYPKDGFGRSVRIEGEAVRLTPKYVMLKFTDYTSNAVVFRNVLKSEIERNENQ